MKKKFAKVAALFAAFVLVIVATVGVTLAYLTDETTAVTNTFIAKSGLLEVDSTFTLTESAVKLNDTKDAFIKDDENLTPVTSNTYDGLLAGMTLYKDPVLNVGKFIAPSYLYIMVTDNLPAELTWTLAEGWTEIADVNGDADGTGIPANKKLYVYNNGNAIAANTVVENLSLIQGNSVTVGDFDASEVEAGDNIQLIFQAFICQSTGVGTAAEAFASLFPNALV